MNGRNGTFCAVFHFSGRFCGVLNGQKQGVNSNGIILRSKAHVVQDEYLVMEISGRDSKGNRQKSWYKIWTNKTLFKKVSQMDKIHKRKIENNC